MIAKVNGTELYYEVYGDGIPLLTMHGGLGFDHTMFRPYLDRLADSGYQVIYYDHRGNGRSHRPDDYSVITMDTMVDDAEALRKYLDLDKMILYGNSLGGSIAQEYAIKYGKHLSGLILHSSVAVLDYPDVIIANAQTRSTPQQMEAIMRVFSEPIPDDETFRQIADTIFPIYFYRPDVRVCSDMARNMYFNAKAYNHFMADCAPKAEIFDRLGDIKTPTLIISGDDDWICPTEHAAQRLHQAISGSQLVIMENCGHCSFAEDTDRLVGMIHKWAQELR